MAMYDRQWFKDVRAIMDKASVLKQTPPQDVVAPPVKPEPPEFDYTHMLCPKPVVYDPSTSTVYQDALAQAAAKAEWLKPGRVNWVKMEFWDPEGPEYYLATPLFDTGI